MTDNKHKFGDLVMTQGTTDYFQSGSNFEEQLSLPLIPQHYNLTLFISS